MFSTLSENSLNCFKWLYFHLINFKSSTPQCKFVGLTLRNRPIENENPYCVTPSVWEMSLIGFHLVLPARSFARFLRMYVVWFIYMLVYSVLNFSSIKFLMLLNKLNLRLNVQFLTIPLLWMPLFCTLEYSYHIYLKWHFFLHL